MTTKEHFNMKVFFMAILLGLSFSYANVIGIDLGSNFLSFGLLKSGKPITVVRNENEKRITPALVTIDGLERFAGVRAASKTARQSRQTANNIIQLLGRYSLPPRLAYPYPHPHYELDEQRGTLLFNASNVEEPIPVEDLAALILQQAQQTTYKSNDVLIKDVVITIPAYFTQSQRQALLDAAKIADLNVMGLITSNDAAAYQYGMERSRTMSEEAAAPVNETAQKDAEDKSKEEQSSARNVVFIDMGGSQTSISLVRYEFPKPNVTEKEEKKTKKEKVAEAKRKKEEEEKRKKEEEEARKKKEEEEEEEDDDDDDDEDLAAETPEEREERKRLEREIAEDDEEEEVVSETINIRNNDDLQAYMKKQEERQKKKKLREERKKRLHEIRTIRKSRKAGAGKSKKVKGFSLDEGFDPEKHTGKMDVLLTVTDESLGGRQFDALIADHLIREFHKQAAPEEVEKYGECRPYLDTEEEKQQKQALDEERDHKHRKRVLPTPLNPPLSAEEAEKKKYPGPKCRRLLDSPSIVPYITKIASGAKEMLTVSPEYHGTLDDLLPELPEFHFCIKKEQLEEIARPLFNRFRLLCEEMVAKYWTLNKTHPEWEVESKVPLSSVVVQMMGGSMRIPGLQSIALSVFNKTELGRLLNVDEAAALGSTMYAATLVERYRLKGVKLVERAQREIVVRIRDIIGGTLKNNEAKPEEDKNALDKSLRLPSEKSPLYGECGMDTDDGVYIPDDATHAVVVRVGETLPLKKTLIIPRTSAYTLSFDYAQCCCCCKDKDKANTNCSGCPKLRSESVPVGVTGNLLKVKVVGSGSSLGLFSNTVDWATRVVVEIGRDGVLRVKKATLDVVGEKVPENDQAAKKPNPEEEEETEKFDDEAEEEKAKKEEKKVEEAAANKEAQQAEKKKKKKKYVKRRMALELHRLNRQEDIEDSNEWKELCEKKKSENENKPSEKEGSAASSCQFGCRYDFVYRPDDSYHYYPMTKKQIKAAKKRLERFEIYEKEKEKIAEARNRLESYVFEMKEKLDIHKAELLKGLALEEQIDNAMKELNDIGLWLEDEGVSLTDPLLMREKILKEEREKKEKGEPVGTEASSDDALQKEMDYVMGVLKEKQSVAEKACNMMDLKLKERSAFPMAVKKFRDMVSKMKEKQDEAVVAGTMTDAEADEMEAVLDEGMNWLKEQETDYKSIKPGEDLRQTSADITEEMQRIEKRAEDMIKESDAKRRKEKYEKERREREERKAKEKEKLKKEKAKREEKKKKKLQEEGGYDEILQNNDDTTDTPQPEVEDIEQEL
ncbi:putative Hypoxia up-regulated protein 1 [Monocercomonoides exilis]|uniref:putative Hypoxia up-regulated protein 1 n=1 Tax=Monocercomonoides exilis TaxID=2049356 RepID=UPI00355A1F81|nr:putative Hypoxia up-regulated protein 1 [Monocercomonoides exilis]|eukprot:MONOS_149.1-p1 / transcript=MONOS_149.1 / gene=MONOS_149 / organism=Monocercomonoides_exilis_PA203 / gene_product=Hypoxia up-regulated protein 1 / transcript_product=Hypoxia up-regulated protein 1 / location=Mono_scaffold00003:26474-30407(-) / protein_length=1293 / sequence_SO=supercontig / SO=protein_coding / is_pseudo=false